MRYWYQYNSPTRLAIFLPLINIIKFYCSSTTEQPPATFEPQNVTWADPQMGSLPNLHELGKEDQGPHYRPGPALGHLCGDGQSPLTQEERARILHRHSGHGRITKARSNGHGSKIVYDDFMLEVSGQKVSFHFAVY